MLKSRFVSKTTDTTTQATGARLTAPSTGANAIMWYANSSARGGRWQCQVRHRGGVPQVTPYVAEFYNTISNIILLAVGLFGLRRCWTLDLEARFYAMSFCTLVVGFGSAAFHGTLRYHWQLMDE